MTYDIRGVASAVTCVAVISCRPILRVHNCTMHVYCALSCQQHVRGYTFAINCEQLYVVRCTSVGYDVYNFITTGYFVCIIQHGVAVYVGPVMDPAPKVIFSLSEPLLQCVV